MSNPYCNAETTGFIPEDIIAYIFIYRL